MKLSLIIPLHNEQQALPGFHASLMPAVKKAAENYEIIYVNDGSTDKTLTIATQLADNDKHIKILSLSRNFGKELAMTAGLTIATGDAIVIMDGDGQHPPELIYTFVEKWKAGNQVVIGVRRSNQQEGAVKHWGSALFYKLFGSLSDTTLTPGATDFRLIDKAVQTEFLRFTERQRVTRGLIDWLGFTRAYVPFDAPARLGGNASYNTGKLVQLAMNSFVSLSIKPLLFFGWIGALITTVSFLAGIVIFVEQFLMHDPLGFKFTGPALLGIFISFLVGLVLISQGIMAIYLSHVHAQTQNRPLFVIDHKNSRGIQ